MKHVYLVFLAVIASLGFTWAGVEAEEGYASDNDFFEHMVRLGVIERMPWFMDIRRAPDPTRPTPEPTPTPGPREIRIDLAHSRTSFDVDYIAVCAKVNFPIPHWHLRMLVTGGEPHPEIVDNYSVPLPEDPPDWPYPESVSPCAEGWRKLGSIQKEGDLLYFPLSDASIPYMETLEAEELTAVSWHCERVDDFLRDALFACTEESVRPLADLRKRDPSDVLVAIAHPEGIARPRVKASVLGTTFLAEPPVEEPYLWNYVSGDELPTEWFAAYGGIPEELRSFLVGQVVIPPRIDKQGLYCMEREDGLVLCDIWSRNR